MNTAQTPKFKNKVINASYCKMHLHVQWTEKSYFRMTAAKVFHLKFGMQDIQTNEEIVRSSKSNSNFPNNLPNLIDHMC